MTNGVQYWGTITVPLPLGLDRRPVASVPLPHGKVAPGDVTYFHVYYKYRGRGGVVVKALRYKPAGRGFDSRWCHWNFSLT